MSAQLELVHPAAPAPVAHLRPDLEVITLLIEDGASVLDVGCGDGALLEALRAERGVRARGLELNARAAQACIKRGLAVVQGDADHDLSAFPSASFDYVVFARALEHLRRPDLALSQARRIGARVIVSTGNAVQWRARLRAMFAGRLRSDPADWRHIWSVRDVAALAGASRLGIERAIPLSRGRAGAPFAKSFARANWSAQEAVFLFTQ